MPGANRSPYDDFMHRCHNAMKESGEFQENLPEAAMGISAALDVDRVHGFGEPRGVARAVRAGADIHHFARRDGASGKFAAANSGAARRTLAHSSRLILRANNGTLQGLRCGRRLSCGAGCCSGCGCWLGCWLRLLARAAESGSGGRAPAPIDPARRIAASRKNGCALVERANAVDAA